MYSLAGTRCNVCVFTEVGRLGRSSSAAGVRQVGGGDVQRQSSLPAREALNQVNIQYNTQPCYYYLQLLITSPPARDSAPADLFIAGRYAH